MTHSFTQKALITLFSLCLIVSFSIPETTHAGFFSKITEWLTGSQASAGESSVEVELRSAQPSLSSEIVETAVNPDPNPAKNETENIVIGDSALVAESGPAGSIAEAEEENYGQISVYTVHKGDTVSSIAKMFEVSVNTVLWANSISAKEIKEGMNLIILPVSGVKYIIKKGDTLKSIANKFKGDVDEIIAFNGLKADQTLVLGEEIIIPDGEAPIVPVYIAAVPGAASNPTSRLRGANVPSYPGYYARPVVCRKTQGLHGWNAVDFGCAPGTTVSAAADGVVIISKTGGWNGGYGNYIVIAHSNGTQTLYGHLLRPAVAVGERVSQSQIIGFTGNTGKSTGPHLHFEIRGGKNPF